MGPSIALRPWLIHLSLCYDCNTQLLGYGLIHAIVPLHRAPIGQLTLALIHRKIRWKNL